MLYIYQVFQAGGVNVDMEKSAFLADHYRRHSSGSRHARRACGQRHAGRAHSWTPWLGLLQGRALPGRPEAEQKAMRLGTQNALFYFHLGMIQDKLGDTAAAKANVRKP